MNDVTSLWKNNKASKTKSQSNIFTYRPTKSPSTSFLIKLAAFVLKRNDFFYNDTLWLQISGTSMGTEMTPSFACLLVVHLEEWILYDHQKTPFLPFIMSWKRYIDDVFLFWKGSVSTVLEFVRFLNEHFADWCFTLVHGSKEINLFGIIVTKKDKYLSTSLYSKPIEIHYFTLQVFSLKKGLPVSQVIRFKCICEIPEQYNYSKEKML